MVPVLGLFATAAVVGIGAAVGWRLARNHLPQFLNGREPATGEGTKRPRVIDADYVDVTDADGPEAAVRARRRDAGPA